MALVTTLYRPCPTCLPNSNADFVFKGAKREGGVRVSSVYKCTNCSHEVTVKHRKRGEAMTPSQKKALEKLKGFTGKREVETRMHLGYLVILIRPNSRFQQTVSVEVGRRGKVRTTVYSGQGLKTDLTNKTSEEAW